MFIRSRLFLTTLTFFAIAHSAIAQNWIDRVFPEKNHEFGTVAVGAKTEHRFVVNNPFPQRMHLRSVRTSCGCTTVSIETEYIEPGQSGAVLAQFRTDTFRGKHGATITVVIDQPFYAEARLVVNGYIRSDMVFHPGEVVFGKVSQGEAATQSTRVLYAGRSDWQILEVLSNYNWLVPSLKQVSRGGGQAEYSVSLTIREDAPEGYFQNEVIVVTNDRAMPRVPLRVGGQVESSLSISPQSIALGSISPDQPITKRLVIRSRQPVIIDSITCEGWKVDFEKPTAPKTTFVLDTIFTPNGVQGAQRKPVVISTAGENSVQAKALLTADIREQ